MQRGISHLSCIVLATTTGATDEKAMGAEFFWLATVKDGTVTRTVGDVGSPVVFDDRPNLVIGPFVFSSSNLWDEIPTYSAAFAGEEKLRC